MSGLRSRLSELRHPERARDRRDNELIRLLIAYCLPVDGIGVDVGAHVGTFTREMLRCAPLGSVLAVEPVPFRAAALREEFDTAAILEVALSDESGTADFGVIHGRDTRSSLHPSWNGSEQVETITVQTRRLDDILRLLPGGPVADVVKIDVEGAEAEVLAGMPETLARGPVVVVEHGARATLEQHAAVFHPLRAAGLRLFTIDGDGPYATLDAFAARANAGDLWTWVAHL